MKRLQIRERVKRSRHGETMTLDSVTSRILGVKTQMAEPLDFESDEVGSIPAAPANLTQCTINGRWRGS